MHSSPSTSERTEYNHQMREWTLRLVIPLAVLAWIALAVVLVWFASHIITTILILLVGALFSYAIFPAVTLLQRFMPRALAITLVYIVGFLLLSLLAYLIISTTVGQITSLARSVSKLFTPVNNGGDAPIFVVLERFGITRDQIVSFGQNLATQVQTIAGTVVGGVIPVVSGTAGVFINIILVVVISIYLQVDGGRVGNWLRKGTPLSVRGRVVFLLNTLEQVVGGYVRGQFLLCAIIGTIVGAGLAVIGMPYAVLLGILSFVLEFIPVLGTIITGVICIMLALTQGWLITFIVLVYFIVVHIVEGYILAPRLVGHAVGLHPIISLLALTAGAELFGPWGAIFASPLVGLIQVIIVTFWKNWRADHKEQFPDDTTAPASTIQQEMASVSSHPSTI